MTKLEELAHGQDEKGCFQESSARVRAAAENALHACRQVIPPSPTPAAPETAPPPKEVPIPAAPQSLPSPPQKPPPPPRRGARDPPPRRKELPIQAAPESLPSPPEKPAPTTGARSSAMVRPVSMAGFAEAYDGRSEKTAETVALARRPATRRCPPGYAPIICPCPPEESKAAAGAAAPEG